MSICRTYAGDVQVTGGLLSLVQVIRNAGVLFQSEAVMAHLLELPKPPDYRERCKELFYKTYAKQATEVGFALDDCRPRYWKLGSWSWKRGGCSTPRAENIGASSNVVRTPPTIET